MIQRTAKESMKVRTKGGKLAQSKNRGGNKVFVKKDGGGGRERVSDDPIGRVK